MGRALLALGVAREQRVLLVLDNLESVREPEAPEVRYRAGYAGYGEVVRRLAESAQKANSDAYEIVAARIKESVAELRDMATKTRA